VSPNWSSREASHVETITRLDSLILAAMLENIADAVSGCQGQWHASVELCASSLRPRPALKPGHFSVWPTRALFRHCRMRCLFRRCFAAPVERADCVVL